MWWWCVQEHRETITDLRALALLCAGNMDSDLEAIVLGPQSLDSSE